MRTKLPDIGDSHVAIGTAHPDALYDPTFYYSAL